MVMQIGVPFSRKLRLELQLRLRRTNDNPLAEAGEQPGKLAQASRSQCIEQQVNTGRDRIARQLQIG